MKRGGVRTVALASLLGACACFQSARSRIGGGLVVANDVQISQLWASWSPTPPGEEPSSSFRTTSKKPKKVIIDPRTGLYRPMKSTDNEKSPSLTWDGFKSLVYNGVDLVSTRGPQAIQKIQEIAEEISAATGKSGFDGSPGAQKRSSNQSNNQQERPVSPGSMTLSELASSPLQSRSEIMGSYKEREEEFMNSLKDSPAKRLMEEFKPPKGMIIDRSLKGDDDVLEKSTFDSLKSVVYSGIDAVSAVANNADDGDAQQQQQPFFSSGASSSQPSSPVKRLPSSLQTREVQARLLASDEEFLNAMEELQSENPVVRLAAGYKVRRMVDRDEILKRQRELAAKREKQVLAIKSGIYQAGDAVVGGAQALAELPQKVSDTYKKTVMGTRQTIKAAKALPGQVKDQVDTVQNKVQEAQRTVLDGVETTKEIIEKTKQLPSQIKTKAKETSDSVQSTAKQTKEVLEGIGKAANELTTSSKVLLGIEKPVPKPPKVEPTKEELQEWTPAKIGWKVVSFTGSLAGKAAWVVGRETTKLAWKGAEIAVSKGQEAFQEAAERDKKRQDLASSAFSKPAVVDKPASVVLPVIDTPKRQIAPVPEKKEKQSQTTTGKKVKDSKAKAADIAKRKAEMEISFLDLEEEISEALRLADDAIKSAKKELGQNEDEDKGKKA